MIEFEDRLFTGDFIFDGAVGRSDFPASDAADMRASIERFMHEFTGDRPLYPGHGPATDIGQAHQFLPAFLRMI